MKLKSLFIVISIIIISLNTSAQHDLQSSFYPDNKFLINPANAGDNESPVFLLGYRNDFVGVSGALRRPMLGYHSPVTKEMGLGALVSLEQVGVFDYYSLAGSYSYTVSLSRKNILRMGVSSGIYSRQVNRGNIEVDQLNDNLLQTQYNSDIFYCAGAGVELGLQDLVINFSVPKLYSGEDKQFAQTVIGGIAYKVRTGNHAFTPSVYYYYLRDLPSRTDLNIAYRYAEKFSLLVSARTDKTFAFGAGISIKSINISYMYELNTKLIPASKGTHEILISYSLEPIKFSPTGRKLN